MTKQIEFPTEKEYTVVKLINKYCSDFELLGRTKDGVGYLITFSSIDNHNNFFAEFNG